MKKKVEILAPAGSFDSMKAAVAAGADAVYMGGSRFGARAYAENPDETGMLEAINYVHLHGRQLYMTVNTLVKEDEMDDLYDYLLPVLPGGTGCLIAVTWGIFLYPGAFSGFAGSCEHTDDDYRTGGRGAYDEDGRGPHRHSA